MNEFIQKAFPELPERLSELGELAYNLWWSWHPEARMLFKMIDRQVWKESVHNPVKVLKQLPEETFERLVSDTGYLRYYDAVIARFRDYMNTKGDWFLENMQTSESLPIAYFSAEYGLHRSLPFYAGGLGFLAGDHIKECSDLGIPIVAIGFMYPGGYVRQKIRDDGWQEGTDQPIDREMAPIIKVMEKPGKQLVVKVPFMEPAICVAVWKVLVGRVNLYLMDTDIDVNEPWNRTISARLYMGDLEQRLRQEIVLGMGGYQVLSALDIEHSGIHLNEGHPAFAILEGTREIIGQGNSLEKAVHNIKSTSIFTTHTPVPAGHDVFPFPLMEKYLSSWGVIQKSGNI